MRDFLDDGDVPDDSLSRCFFETRHLVSAAKHVDELLEVRRTSNHAWACAVIGPPLPIEALSQVATQAAPPARAGTACWHPGHWSRA